MSDDDTLANDAGDPDSIADTDVLPTNSGATVPETHYGASAEGAR